MFWWLMVIPRKEPFDQPPYTTPYRLNISTGSLSFWTDFVHGRTKEFGFPTNSGSKFGWQKRSGKRPGAKNQLFGPDPFGTDSFRLALVAEHATRPVIPRVPFFGGV